MELISPSEPESGRDDEESCEDRFLPPPMAWFEDSSRGSDAVTRTSLEPESEHVEPPQVVAFPINSIPATATVGAPFPSPSWKEISSQVLPAAARELLSSSMQRLYYTARVSYARGRWVRKYSELGNNTGGYFRPSAEDTSLPKELLEELPPFSSLPWVDRQLVREWRTYLTDSLEEEEASSNEEIDFDRARTLVPVPQPRPTWQNGESCAACRKTFGPTRLRHHCRMCGNSFCQPHSSQTHKLPHLGYDPDVPERVCDSCKLFLLEQNLAERVAWRLARCRDYKAGALTPYFETGVETMEEVAMRISQAALTLAKSIPLGAQATVAVETVDVLRKHGLNGIYTIMLRQEFLAAADLLRKALGINRKAWPLSVHELSAAIFYALAQHRALRGLNPEREHLIHSFRKNTLVNVDSGALLADEAEVYKMGEVNIADLISSAKRDGAEVAKEEAGETLPFTPVCDPISDKELSSLIFYAPIALNFIYSEKEVDMQLLAAQQGWRLLYAYMQQDAGRNATDRPVSALFVHEDQKIACLAVRGTATIHDVITDIRQVPVPFPENEGESTPSTNNRMDDDWTAVFRGHGVAVCGMAGAAINLYREHIDSIMFLAKEGYRIRLTGHSLGGGVATLLGVLLHRDLSREGKNCGAATDCSVRVYAYGTPPCVDSKLASFVESFVSTVVLHDDVIPRLTPLSCRGLLKHLLHIKETWVKAHLPDDLKAITDRARTAWAPKWRGSFTLSSSSSIKRYCKSQLQLGKRKILSVKGKLLSDYVPAEKGSLAFNAPREKLSNMSLEESGCSVDDEDDEVGNSDGDRHDDEIEETKLLIDYLGGADYRSEGVIIDGEEFFDTEDNLLDDDSAGTCSNDVFDDALCESILEQQEVSSSNRKFVESGGGTVSGAEIDVHSRESPDSEGETPGAVVLEEIALPKMFVPGKIVHIYSHRGVYKAAYVPRSFRELRRISLAGNMLADHKCKSYYEALLELRTAREAPEAPPLWTAFDEDDTCSCCASRFTWASTSDSEAQEARDKHNCRSCGTLVCDPCSKNRMPLPSIGITVPARVCDRCYNDINGAFTGAVRNTRSFLAESENEQGREDEDDVPEKPVRERERRSSVVDELASRIHAPALRCS